MSEHRRENPISLILEGGWMRFPAFIGALRAIEEKKLSPSRIIGSGAGSLIGTLYATGVSLEEMQRDVLELDVRQFMDPRPGNFKSGKGLYDGNLLEQWIDRKVDGATFSGSFRMAPQVVATDILNYRPVLFTAEEYPDIKLSAAVRYSMGTPWIFAYRHVTLRGQEHVLIDGTYMAGAVAKMVEREEEQSLILKVVSKRTLNSLLPGPLTTQKYFLETLNFSLHALEKEFIKGGKWRDTIILYCGDIPPAKYNLSVNEKRYLLEQGYEQTMKYLEYKWGI